MCKFSNVQHFNCLFKPVSVACLPPPLSWPCTKPCLGSLSQVTLWPATSLRTHLHNVVKFHMHGNTHKHKAELSWPTTKCCVKRETLQEAQNKCFYQRGRFHYNSSLLFPLTDPTVFCCLMLSISVNTEHPALLAVDARILQVRKKLLHLWPASKICCCMHAASYHSNPNPLMNSDLSSPLSSGLLWELGSFLHRAELAAPTNCGPLRPTAPAGLAHPHRCQDGAADVHEQVQLNAGRTVF